MRRFILILNIILITLCTYSQNQNSMHSCGEISVHNEEKNYGVVRDICGNSYRTIKIGNQVWMAENLKTTKYRNGKKINNITDSAKWDRDTIGAYTSINNDTLNDCPYGKLYNWYAVNNSNKICPQGWHIPSFDEFEALILFLGDRFSAAGLMQSKGSGIWEDPDQIITNASGLSILPTRKQEYQDAFIWGSDSQRLKLYQEGKFKEYLEVATAMGVGYNIVWLKLNDNLKNGAMFVRCIKNDYK